jgi:hypothetical protein
MIGQSCGNCKFFETNISAPHWGICGYFKDRQRPEWAVEKRVAAPWGITCQTWEKEECK